MTRQEIIAKYPLADYIQSRGIEVTSRNNQLKCCCPFHKDSKPSLEIDDHLWICRAGCGGGSVIDFVSKLDGISIREAMEKLSGDLSPVITPQNAPKPKSATKTLKSPENKFTGNLERLAGSQEEKLTATYDYQDPTGQTKYQVLRYEPKTFRQRKVNPDGSFTWNMDGVERLPFQLPKILESDSVVIVEGEKDCLTLSSIGITATCNPGGAGKWLPSFSQYLEGKKVTIIPDNDEPGLNHARAVLKTLEGRVEHVKWIELPKEHNGKKVKDVTDLRDSCENEEKFAEVLVGLVKKARLISRGIESDIISMEELQSEYRASISVQSEYRLDLERWMPGLRVRPRVPGDLMGIMASTSGGKTLTLQNILACCPELSQLIFEIEISKSLAFERSVAIATRTNAEKVEETYSKGQWIDWKKTNRLKNLYFCFTPTVTMKYIDEQIERAAAKIGEVPKVWAIDYLQLVRSEKNDSRYETVSRAAEEAKLLCKKYNNIGIIISQTGRLEEGEEPSLTSAKESGSIENSVGLLLAVWKSAKDRMKARVLKNTNGSTGQYVEMSFHGPSLVQTPL